MDFWRVVHHLIPNIWILALIGLEEVEAEHLRGSTSSEIGCVLCRLVRANKNELLGSFF